MIVYRAIGACARLLSLLGALVIFLTTAAPPALAATFTVNTTADAADPCAATCSLRGAIIAATAAPGMVRV
jgi:CSLREA domain-containing protein